VKVSFVLPSTMLSMKFIAEVAWKDKQGNAGIRFMEAAPRIRRELRLWLERQYFTR
jgi:hypothetical protein